MAKRAELSELQTLAQSYYDRKQYPDALDNFSRAVVLARKWSPSDVLPILDQRIAVYVKLGNVDLARKDAMSMIRSNKSDARGYLRCGQLDRLQDNPSSAWCWYEHGLKQVPLTNPLHSTLEMQRDKTGLLLKRRLVSSKRRDPVSTLPTELLQSVVAYLNYVDAVRAMQVSKTWKRTLSMLRPLIDTIDFGSSRKAINCKMMAAALERLGPRPRVLITRNSTKSATNLLHEKLERYRNCTHLEELAISPAELDFELLPLSMYNLKVLTIEHAAIGQDTMVDIMKACQSLEVARFMDVRGMLSSNRDTISINPLFSPSVRTLQLRGDLDGGRHLLQLHPDFFACFPKLEELKCNRVTICYREDKPFDLSSLTQLLELSCSSCSIPEWPKLPPNIEVWDNRETYTFLNLARQTAKLGELSKLRCLRFSKTSPPPPSWSFLPATATQSLVHLDLRGTPVTSTGGEHFFALLQICQHLKNLRELAWGGTHDEGISFGTALSKLAKLERLSLQASQLSGAELIDLLRRPDNRLQQLALIDCDKISAETSRWAQDQGITVHTRKT